MSKALDVVVDAQLSYLLPSQGETHIPRAERIIVPGLEWLSTRTDKNSAGVMFTENKFTADEYSMCELRHEFQPHCLVGDLGDYDPVGVQNAFNQRLLVSRGVPVFHLHKKTRNMWDLDMWDSHSTVHTFRGSSASAYTLPEFVGTQLEGVKRVNIWGVSGDGAVLDAIDGFLARKFGVNVITNLCRSRVYDIEDLLSQPKYAQYRTNSLLSWELFSGSV